MPRSLMSRVGVAIFGGSLAAAGLLGASAVAAQGSPAASGADAAAAQASLVPSGPDGIPAPRASTPDEMLAAGSCRAGVMADSVCVTRDIAAWRGVPFTPPGVASICSAGGSPCPILMDVYAPTATGPWPLVIVVPGGGMAADSTKSYIDDFALEIADRGAVVMTAEWRQYFGHPTADPDVACAVGVARLTGPAYGANPARVVLAGHSDGVGPVVGAAFAIPPLTPDAGTCDATIGSLRPDAMVAIAGVFDLKEVGLVASAASPDERIPVVVAQGGADDTYRVSAARAFQALLVGDGWDSTLVEVPTADHPGILYEPAVIDAVMGLTKAQ